MNSLEEIRKQIDQIDNEIISLLGARAILVNKIGELKANKNKNKNKIQDIRREKQIIRKVRQQALENGLDPAVVEKIYKELFAYFVSCQKNHYISS